MGVRVVLGTIRTRQTHLVSTNYREFCSVGTEKGECRPASHWILKGCNDSSCDAACCDESSTSWLEFGGVADGTTRHYDSGEIENLAGSPSTRRNDVVLFGI